MTTSAKAGRAAAIARAVSKRVTEALAKGATMETAVQAALLAELGDAPVLMDPCQRPAERRRRDNAAALAQLTELERSGKYVDFGLFEPLPPGFEPHRINPYGELLLASEQGTVERVM